MVYVDRMRKALTGRTGDWLARNSYPRLIVFGSYGVASLAAYQCSVSLSQFGIQNLTLRMAGSFSVAYLTYTVLIGAWLACMPTLGQQQLMEGASRQIETYCPSDSGPEWLEEVADEAQRAMRRDSRSLLGLVFGLAILGVIFLLAHWVIYARWYLGELMVLAGKVKHGAIRGVAPDAWVVEPIRQSIWMAFGLLLHFMLMGMLLSTKFA